MNRPVERFGQEGSVLANALVPLCLVVAVFGLMELGVRVLEIDSETAVNKAHLVADPELMWKGKPNYHNAEATIGSVQFEVKHNQFGFRDVEHATDKPGETYRIVVLGDEHSYGTGVQFDEVYVNVVGEMLNRRYGGSPAVEIINMSMTGYWTLHEKLILERYGLKYRPDLVIVGYSANDIGGARDQASNSVVKNGRLVPRDSSILAKTRIWLTAHSQLFRVVHGAWRSQPARQNRQNRIQEPDVMLLRKELIRIVEMELAHIVNMAKSSAAKTSVMIFDIPQLRRLSAQGPRKRRRLTEFCEQQGCIYVDGYDAVMSHEQPMSLFLPTGRHYTGAGQGILAVALYNAIIENSLIPDP